MRAWVRVVSPTAYEQYVRQKREELTKAQEDVQRRVTGLTEAVESRGPVIREVRPAAREARP
jgi:hypothetical protein